MRCPVEAINKGNVRLDNVIVGGSNTTCKFDLLEPNQVQACTLYQAVSQDDFDNGTVVVAVASATAKPRGVRPELPSVPQDDAVVAVALDRTPALDLSCSVDKGYVTWAGERNVMRTSGCTLAKSSSMTPLLTTHSYITTHTHATADTTAWVTLPLQKQLLM